MDINILGLAYNLSLWAALCFIAGFALVAFEMFQPGFGAPGITGIIFLLLGVILASKSLWAAAFLILVILLVLAGMLALAFHSATKGRLSKTMVLSDALKKESGFVGTENLDSFLGTEGTALTVLRPAGIADFGGEKLDVVSEGQYIPSGASVKVVKVEGRRIVVRKI